MADKITETDVVQIQAQDSDNNKYSFNVENPKTGTTITNVREAFQPLINSGKWISKQGFPFSYIPQATLTKTKKIELGESGETITVTPSTGNITTAMGGKETFTVAGSPIKGYTIKKMTTQETNVSLQDVKIDPVLNTITTSFNITGNFGDNYQLNIVTIAGSIEVPITIQGL